MKLDQHGIRFRVWIAFFILALGIVLFIGVLQVGMIRPYYRNTKMRAVQTVADHINLDLIQDGTKTGIDEALQEAVANNACVVIYNSNGQQIYDADSLGAGCIFSNVSSVDNESFKSVEGMMTLLNENPEYSINLMNQITEQEMIVYGKHIQANLGNYYLFVNSPLEPVDSIVSIFTGQYFLYMILALIVASLVAFYITSRITKPILEMKNQVRKLGKSDEEPIFEGGEFTETKQLANNLNEANEKLCKIDELRRDLIANVSHDIRTPLTNIKAYAEMIQDVSYKDDEKRNQHLNVIIRETDYMNHLVNDMSNLSKMQSGNAHLHKENIDLVEKIKEIVEMDAPLIEHGKFNIVLEMPESLTIYADDTKIGQVIANYLSNAIKHSPNGATITIRAYTLDDEETTRFEVQDEGEGIPKEELPYIWDRYQKSSRSFSRSLTSTGLGLAIVKAIADSHHATCGAYSEEGKGSTFYFELKETHEV